MAIVQRLMGSGFAPQAAVNAVGDFSGALTATGTTQGTALALTAATNYVGTTAGSTGVQLPACSPGDIVYVYNGGASTLSVYGQTGDAIAGGAANAAFSVATVRGCAFIRVTATLWGTIYGA
jgi:hypothetical protein